MILAKDPGYIEIQVVNSPIQESIRRSCAQYALGGFAGYIGARSRRGLAKKTQRKSTMRKQTVTKIVLLAAVAGLFLFAACQNPTLGTVADSGSDLSTMGKKGPKSDDKPNNVACTTIQDGILTYSTGHYQAGQPLKVGFDPYGYNYQAHMYNGSYANVYLGRDGFPPYEGDDVAYLADNPGAASHWTWPYRDIQLVMKWNEAWLSNKDCDGDGKLDRYYGFDSYIGSSAWLTNHMSGWDADGRWTYFVKIVAAPDDAYAVDGIWYAADGTEIGPEIWGAFAIIQEVESGDGATYVSPSGPGFGKF